MGVAPRSSQSFWVDICGLVRFLSFATSLFWVPADNLLGYARCCLFLNCSIWFIVSFPLFNQENVVVLLWNSISATRWGFGGSSFVPRSPHWSWVVVIGLSLMFLIWSEASKNTLFWFCWHPMFDQPYCILLWYLIMMMTAELTARRSIAVNKDSD